MRKLVLNGVSALAITVAIGGVAWAADPADLYVAPAAALDGLHDWSGTYVGGHLGFGKADSYWFDSTNVHNNEGSLVGGLQLGYNGQAPGSSFVWGVEVDASAAGLFGGDNGYATADVNGLASLRGRLGFAFDDIQVYGTGGAGLVFGQGASSSGVRVDFTEFVGVLGGGVEWASDDRVSWRGEALYFFETDTFDAGDDLGRVDGIWVARFGVNVKLQ